MKLGIIGCGKIAGYHLSSMRKAGFTLHSISGTNNSSNAVYLKEKFNINKVYSSTEQHINSGEYDCLLLLTPHETTYDYLSSINSSTKILAEKPITYFSHKLNNLKNKKNIKIAFNRRQYNSVANLKSYIDKNHIFFLEANIPESIFFLKKQKSIIDISSPQEKYNNIFNNSIHIFDLISYMTGNLEIKSIHHLKNESDILQGYIVFISGEKVKNIIIKSVFNSPDNFYLNAYSNLERFEMRPIESFTRYNDLRTIEPTTNYPLRTFAPIELEKILEPVSKESKPGFDKQAKAFFDFCCNKPTNLADIDDMLNSILMAEQILKSVNDISKNNILKT